MKQPSEKSFQRSSINSIEQSKSVLGIPDCSEYFQDYPISYSGYSNFKMITSVDSQAKNLSDQAVQLITRSNHPESLRKAVEMFTKSIQLVPNNSRFYGNRSLCHFKLGLYEESLTDADLALQFEPDNLKFLKRKAQSLLQLKRLKEAYGVSEKMIEVDTNGRWREDIMGIQNEAKNQLSHFQAIRENTLKSVIIRNLPNTVDHAKVRDLIYSFGGVALSEPVQFLRSNAMYKTCLAIFENNQAASIVLQKLNKLPYGQAVLSVELVQFEDLPRLRQQVITTTPLSEESMAELSDDEQQSYRNDDRNPKTIDVVQSFMESKGKTSLFVGNIPSDTEANEVDDFVQRNVPEVQHRFSIAKRPHWDYCFINCQTEGEAYLLLQRIDRARFGRVILDVKIQTFGNKVNGTAKENPVLSESSLKNTQSAIWISCLPNEFQLHDFVNSIYLNVSDEIKSDFGIFKMSDWQHCFINFENPTAAEKALHYVNGMPFNSHIIVGKLTDSKFLQSGSRHQGYRDFLLSLSNRSSWLRIDNIDKLVTDDDLRKHFGYQIQILAREHDFGVAYLRFDNVDVAAAMFSKLQGCPLKRACLVIRFAVPRQ